MCRPSVGIPEMLGLLVEADDDARVASESTRLLGSAPDGLERPFGSLSVRLCPGTGVDGGRVPTDVLYAALSSLEPEPSTGDSAGGG